MCAALRPPPTPAHSDALLTVSFSAGRLVIPPPETTARVRPNVPAAATKPPPIEIASVPSTFSSIAPERLRPKLPPPPSIFRSDQLSGDAPTALLTSTLRPETYASRTSPSPSSVASATVNLRPVYVTPPVVVIAPSVKLTSLALIPAVPGTTAVCVAFNPPPTPAQREALMMLSFSAVSLVSPPPETMKRSRRKVPAAATKPLAMLTPRVPPTLNEIAPDRSRPIPSAVQFSGVGDTPPVAVLVLMSMPDA